MKKLVIAVVFVVLSCALVGCNGHVYSPPARLAPLESSKTVGVGRTSGGASVGTHGALFGAETNSGTLRVRHGVGETVELGLDANLMLVDVSEAAADVNPAIWSARLAGKWAPDVLGGHAALIYGVGGGTSQAGQFVSPDAGIVAAYENRYVVPFFSVGGFVSEPINAQSVDVSTKEQGLGTNVMSPQRTWGATFSAGVKVPVQIGGTTISPIVGLSRTLIDDGDESTDVTGGSLGVDVAFD